MVVEKIVIRIFFNDYLFVILHPHFTLRLMNTLDKYLKDDSVRGVVHTAAGEVIEFHNPGVKTFTALWLPGPMRSRGPLCATV